MNSKISAFIDKIKELSPWAKIVVYLIGYVLSHLSISVIYHLALYNYSVQNSIPYLYANKISINDIYPSLLYLKVPYLVLSLLLYFVTIAVVKNLKLKQKSNSFLKEKYERLINVLRKYIPESDLHKQIMETKSGANLTIFTGLTFILYILLSGNTVFQQIIIAIVQYSVPVYFAYKVAFKNNYVSLFFSILPLLLFFSSLTLFMGTAI